MSATKTLDAYTPKEIGGITDQAVIIAIAKSSSDWKARRVAVQKIQNVHQRILEDIAKGDPNRRVRASAIVKLYDKAVLKEIGEKDRDPAVREAAQRRTGQLLEKELRLESKIPAQTSPQKTAQSI